LTEHESTALEIVARYTGLAGHEIMPASSLEEMGVDSLQFILILLEIQKALGRDILTVDNVGSIKTVGDIISLVRQPREASPE
jgi:acyl carrier protein